jgi:hypothetical protein
VLAAAPGDTPGEPCRRLFEETLHGLREEAVADPRAADVVGMADDAYAAQHHAGDTGDAALLAAALDGLAARLAQPPAHSDTPPARWRTTVADVAADLDVVDLSVLVEAWAKDVWDDWSRAGAAE